MQFSKHFPATRWLLRRLVSRRFWYIVAICAAPIVLGMSAIQVDQMLFRHKAERLVSNIRELQFGKTTLAEARQSLHQWPEGAWHGDCDRACIYEIGLESFSLRHGDFFLGHPVLQRLRLRLGGHPARVLAVVRFAKGVLQSGSVGVHLWVTSYLNPDGDSEGYTLIGDASFMSRLELERSPALLVREQPHATYWVHQPGGCEGCMMIGVTFLSGASHSDIERLMLFDFSCLTLRLHPCRVPADIMPAAWQQFLDDEAQRPQGP
ncbi:MAG TPA: hypothetical protein VN176_05105 [Verrucomicrobiae bacterium]|jgi:hypothetical protein|nr:hypothetical protein [Verrucomicrobiae bacterium]